MAFSRLALRIWPWAMALLVCAPMLAPGYVLSYDMVWVPRLSVTRPDVWGLGSALPRAVPSDAVVAVLNTVVPGQILQKSVLVLAIGLAGVGATRLLPTAGTAARLATASWFVWNPFVVERLVLGQWPLLVGYAAFPWLIRGCLDRREDSPTRWWSVVVPLAVTAISAATGLMGALLALCVAGRRRAPTVGAVALLVNLPWIVAGLARAGDGVSDPDAVRLFEVQPELHLGRLGAVLSLGGVWNADVVPTSRTLLVSTFVAVLVWAVMAVGFVARAHAPVLVRTLAVPAVVGLVLALAGWVATEPVEWLVAHVPGGGLVRDGTRYLGLVAPLQAVLFGLGVSALRNRLDATAARAFAAVILVLVPVAALPDMAWGAAGTLRPVAYPESWTAARAAIASSDHPGDIVILPFSAYRAPSWNRDHPVLDPAGRFFTRETVVDDSLVVSGRVIAGEDPRARRVNRVLAGNTVVDGLRQEGIGFVVVENDAGPVGPALGQLRALPRIFDDPLLTVYEVPST